MLSTGKTWSSNTDLAFPGNSIGLNCHLIFCYSLSLELCDWKLILPAVPGWVIILPPNLMSSDCPEKSLVQFSYLPSLFQTIAPTAAAPNSLTTGLCLRGWLFVCFIYKSCWWKHFCNWTQ